MNRADLWICLIIAALTISALAHNVRADTPDAEKMLQKYPTIYTATAPPALVADLRKLVDAGKAVAVEGEDGEHFKPVYTPPEKSVQIWVYKITHPTQSLIASYIGVLVAASIALLLASLWLLARISMNRRGAGVRGVVGGVG